MSDSVRRREVMTVSAGRTSVSRQNPGLTLQTQYRGTPHPAWKRLKQKRVRTGKQHEPLNHEQLVTNSNQLVAGFGASAGGAGAFVAAAGVGDDIGATAAAGPALHPPVLQPLVQLVVMMFEPQVLQPVLQPVLQVLQGAGVAQQR